MPMISEKHLSPGLLRRKDNPDVRMMLCTAGHVDHGKTRLVGLLTGCATDRLKEEQERGLTIDLGFAPCVMGEGVCVGIVDVPGHEKFIKNMVAGVSGIDMAILVVAADDGVMPQTIEHLQIMTLLGVSQGIVALNKIDLVDADRVTAVQEQIKVLLKGSSLEGAPICPVSAESGEGIFEFYEVLRARINALARRRRGGVFRMPVERTFAQKGFGTVVTGIPVAGTVHVGQKVELVPGETLGHVRGIQRFLRPANEGSYGQCLALNIPEFSKIDVQRGQVLCEPGYLDRVTMLHLQLRAVNSLDAPVTNAETVKLHTGTTEASGTLYLLREGPLGAGESCLATVVLQQPVAAAAQDRFILRRPSPPATIGGGEILDTQPGGPRPRKKVLLDRLHACCGALAQAQRDEPAFDQQRVCHLLEAVLPQGTVVDAVSRRLLLTPQETSGCLAALAESGKAVMIDTGYWIGRDNYARYLGQAEAHVQALAAQKTWTLPLLSLQAVFGWPQPLWRSVLKELEQRGRVEVSGERVLVCQAVEALSPEERELKDRIARLFEERRFETPRPEELPQLLNAPPHTVKKMLDLLFHERRLVRLSSSVVLDATHFKDAQALVVRRIHEQGTVDSADFKLHIGSSRKYALAILDYLDGLKVTVRLGNLRKLAPNYEARLL